MSQGPSVQAVMIRRSQYVVWTKMSKEAATKRDEVVVTGRCSNVTPEAIANKLVAGCSEWVERVQVVRRGESYKAWIIVRDDKVWEFIQWFNCTKVLKDSTASVNGRMRATHDVVISGAGKIIKEDIETWAGRDNVQRVELRGNSAIVSTKGPSYVNALLEKPPMGNTKTRKFVHKTLEPMDLLKRSVAQLQRDMNKMLDDYRRSVEEIRFLKSEMMKMRLRVSKLDGANKSTIQEKVTTPRDTLEEPQNAVQTMEDDPVSTPVAQIKNRGKLMIDKGQRRMDDFVNNRGKKRDAREVDDEEVQRKIIMTNSPNGTIRVNSTQESVVPPQEHGHSEL